MRVCFFLMLVPLQIVHAECPLGQYMTKIGGETHCRDCPVGKHGYTPALGDTPCRDCSAGKYSNVSGLTACFNCAAGNSSSIGAESCTLCEPGTASLEGALCYDCSPGKYANTEGSSSCIQCPPGTFLDAYKSAGQCDNCAAGKYSLHGAITCTECNVSRQYQDETGASHCTTCPDNKHPTYDRLACITCPVGKYSNDSTTRCEASNPVSFARTSLQENECPIFGANEVLWSVAEPLEAFNLLCGENHVNKTSSNTVRMPTVSVPQGQKLPLTGGSTMYPFWFEAYYMENENHILFLDRGGLYGQFHYKTPSDFDTMSVLYSLDTPDEIAVFKYVRNYIIKILIREHAQHEQYMFPIGDTVTLLSPFYIDRTHISLLVLFKGPYSEIAILNMHAIEFSLLQQEKDVQACENIAQVCAVLSPDNISAASLSWWKKVGIVKWVQGTDGQSCDAVCMEADLVCDETNGRFPRLDLQDGKALFPTNGWYVEAWNWDEQSSYYHFSLCDEFKENNFCLICPYIKDNNCYFREESEYAYAPSCSQSLSNYRRVCPCGTYDAPLYSGQDILSFIQLFLDLPTHLKDGVDNIVDIHIDPNFRVFVKFQSGIERDKWHVFSGIDAKISEYFNLESNWTCGKGSQPKNTVQSCLERMPRFQISSTLQTYSAQTFLRMEHLEIPLVQSDDRHEYTIESLNASCIFEILFMPFPDNLLQFPGYNDPKIELEAPGGMILDEYARRYGTSVWVNDPRLQSRRFVSSSPIMKIKIGPIGMPLSDSIAVNVSAFTDFAACQNAQDFVCEDCPDNTFKDWEGSGNCVRCQTNAYPTTSRLDDRFACVCDPYNTMTRDNNGVYGCTGCTGNTHLADGVPLPNYHVSYVCRLCPQAAYATHRNTFVCTCVQPGYYHNIANDACTYGSDDFIQCSPGTFSDTGTQPCVGCAQRTFAPSNGATACSPCPRGMTTVGTNATFCVFCSAWNQAHCPGADFVDRQLPFDFSLSGITEISKRTASSTPPTRDTLTSAN